MNRAELATLIGMAGGGLAGGLAGYALTDRKRRWYTRMLNAFLGATGGLVLGGAAGRLGNAQYDFMKRRTAARTPAGKKVPGRVYYVSHPNNAIEAGKTGIPLADELAGKIKAKTGWDGKATIGHAGLITVDGDGKATRYDYGLFGKPNAELLKNEFNVKGLTEEQIAQLIQKATPHWGDKVELFGTDVPDINVAHRYMEGIMAPGSDVFTGLPGGYSCGSVAANAFEAARNSRVGRLLAALRGGTPSQNAPTYGTRHVAYGGK